MLTVRLRSRDGLERVQVPADSTLGTLRQVVADKIQRPVDQMHMSCDQTLVGFLLKCLRVTVTSLAYPSALRVSSASAVPAAPASYDKQLKSLLPELQLASKSPDTYLDLSEDDAKLSDVGFKNGDMVRHFARSPHQDIASACSAAAHGGCGW
jgi:Nuclear pore localisation protein NPL4